MEIKQDGVYYSDKTNGIYILTDIDTGFFEDGPAVICTYENDEGFWKKTLIGPEIINEYVYLGKWESK